MFGKSVDSVKGLVEGLQGHRRGSCLTGRDGAGYVYAATGELLVALALNSARSLRRVSAGRSSKTDFLTPTPSRLRDV